MNSTPLPRLYFLGIGGSAMGALACACQELGYTVGGADSGVYSPMKEQLDSRRIVYGDGYDEATIKSFAPDIVVVGNAISRGNVELEYALNNRLSLQSMPEIVRSIFIAKHTSVVVSGTHGKTTTSSLIAYALSSANRNTGFFIGAVTGNFGTGCKAVSTSQEPAYFVSEGDEYDTAFFDKRSKFLSYRPDQLVINNIEFDHADIFNSLDDILRSFRLLIRLVPQNGLVVANADDLNVAGILSQSFAPVQTFGFSSQAYWRAVDIHYASDATHFTVLKNGFIFHRFTVRILGEHGVRNALACIAIAHQNGMSLDEIQSAFDGFIPPKRRLEELSTYRGATVIDDFGHHPTAIRVTIGATRQKYPGRRVIACFEPRSNTTARSIFQGEFAAAFEEADVVVLGCVFRPERFSDAERLNTEQLANDLRAMGKQAYAVPAEASSQKDWGRLVREYLDVHIADNDVVLLLSNGDFGQLRQLLTEH